MRGFTRRTASLVLGLTLLLSFVPALSIGAVAPANASFVRNDSVSSTNWSGYAVTGAAGSVSFVKGSWIVPTIQGSCPSTAQYSSHWVGIDGYSSGTVEQTGTDSDCQNGSPRYYAWYEFYPHPSFQITSLTIRPGDVIVASVQFSGGKFHLTITDETAGGTFSISARVNSAQRSSAEWITEAPSSSGGVLPLANFGTVSWGTDFTSQSMTNFAVIGGTTGSIGSFGSSVHSITMATSGGTAKATPSALSSDGTSFTVTWNSAGP